MAKESYTDLIYQLGDLAREHLADEARAPKKMAKVFAAEDNLVALREEVQAIEAELNGLEDENAAFEERIAAEKAEQEAITKKWRAAVVGVESRSREMKKSVSSIKAAFRYRKLSHKRAEQAHAVMEQREGHDAKKIALSAEHLKKNRLSLMREQRRIEELEYDLSQVLTPRPGQPGAQGILAFKRILELEDEQEEHKAEHDAKMKELEESLAAKDADVKAAEEHLDASLYELGEEVYGDRVPHALLNPLYPRLDKAG